MRFVSFFTVATAIATASANHLGFNYDANVDFATEFKRARQLAGGSLTSARLYTMIQPGTTNGVIGAVQAAIDTKTTLLLGLWASEDQAAFDNEVSALKTAIKNHGTALTSLIVGVSVGSEDLYRISPTGIENNSGVGAEPGQLVKYIKQTKNALKSLGHAGLKVGHVDTYTAWVNNSNVAVVNNVDFLGVDAYPWYQTTDNNAIGNAHDLFYDALKQTKNHAQGKPVWITETGWPHKGANSGDAVASVHNAKIYWDKVFCSLKSAGHNVWWFDLQDPGQSPAFGVLPNNDLQAASLYSLAC